MLAETARTAYLSRGLRHRLAGWSASKCVFDFLDEGDALSASMLYQQKLYSLDA